MTGLQNDDWYPILKMRYFDGMSGDDIAKTLGCTPPNITHHKNRLVKELAIRIFPDEVIKEMLV